MRRQSPGPDRGVRRAAFPAAFRREGAGSTAEPNGAGWASLDHVGCSRTFRRPLGRIDGFLAARQGRPPGAARTTNEDEDRIHRPEGRRVAGRQPGASAPSNERGARPGKRRLASAAFAGGKRGLEIQTTRRRPRTLRLRSREAVLSHGDRKPRAALHHRRASSRRRAGRVFRQPVGRNAGRAARAARLLAFGRRRRPCTENRPGGPGATRRPPAGRGRS